MVLVSAKLTVSVCPCRVSVVANSYADMLLFSDFWSVMSAVLAVGVFADLQLVPSHLTDGLRSGDGAGLCCQEGAHLTAESMEPLPSPFILYDMGLKHNTRSLAATCSYTHLWPSDAVLWTSWEFRCAKYLSRGAIQYIPP